MAISFGTGADDDTVTGTAGDDVIIAGLGNDVIDGGEGSDTVDFSASTTGVNVDLAVGAAFTNGASQVFATQGTDTAEIVAFDPVTQQFFVAGGGFIDVLDANGTLVASIQVATEVTSVSVSSTGLLAAGVPADPESDPGQVLVFEIAGINSASTPVQTFTVGALPDSVAFTPDGTTIIVANEGEADIIEDEENETFSVGAGGDPEGSISVIDVDSGTITALDFTSFFDANPDAALPLQIGQPGVTDTTLAQDLEPEFVTVSPDGQTAFVSIQENNAIAIIDLSGAAPVLSDVVPLGSIDLSTVAIDANDNDGVPNQVLIPGGISLLQPDAIAAFEIGGLTFVATANEGDGRDFDVFDLDDTTLDPAAFPNAAELQDNDTGIGDFEVSQTLGDTDGDGDIDQIVGFGGRSFSILDADGNEVFNSGNALTSILIERFPVLFNDARSDDAGPEPESVTVAEIDGSTFLFVGLERSAAVVAFELELVDGTGVSTPAEFDVTFAGLVGVPIPGGLPLGEDLDDLVAPEGLLVISADDSPTGETLIVISDEEQGVTFGFNLALGASTTSSLTSVENIVGTAFDDAIAGDANANSLAGGGGNDTLVGGGGADTLTGGDGDDILRGGGGADVIDGGEGVDTNSFEDIGVGVTANLNTGQALYVASSGAVIVENFTGIENLTGTSADDSLTGDAGANALVGGDGDDTLRGGAGNDDLDAGDGDDVVFAGAGNDVISGGDGADSIFALSGNDTVNAGDGDDFVIGGSGSDNLSGGEGNDTLFAGAGADFLEGGAGDDVLNASAGADTLYGGAGDDILTGQAGTDTFVFGDDAGSDKVTDFANGQDAIDFTAFGFTDVADVLALATQVEGDVVFALSADVTVTLENTALADLDASDFLL